MAPKASSRPASAPGSRAALKEEVQCLQARVVLLEAQVAELLAARFAGRESGSEPESEWERPAATPDGDSSPAYLAHAEFVRIASRFVLPSHLRRDTGRFYVVDVGNSRGRSGLYTTYRSYGEAVRDLALPWPSYHHKLHLMVVRIARASGVMSRLVLGGLLVAVQTLGRLCTSTEARVHGSLAAAKVAVVDRVPF